RRLTGGAMPPMRSREEWSRLWQAGMGRSLHQFVSMYSGGRGRGEDGGAFEARSPAEDSGYGRFEMPSINIYRRGVDGNTPPLRQIRGGPAGKVGLMIGNPGAVGYDSKRQEILVPN